jgi:hypothetical protein
MEAVVLHNMGNTKWDNLIEKAMNKITKAVWNGRNSRYPSSGTLATTGPPSMTLSKLQRTILIMQ